MSVFKFGYEVVIHKIWGTGFICDRGWGGGEIFYYVRFDIGTRKVSESDLELHPNSEDLSEAYIPPNNDDW